MLLQQPRFEVHFGGAEANAAVSLARLGHEAAVASVVPNNAFVTPIVDRIGAGDAFAAGVLHGLRTGMPDADGLRFGLAAACLKHSIPGDFNLAGSDDIMAFLGEQRFDVRR
jgi:sugar/nucleoside kinase (ribokinase family)